VRSERGSVSLVAAAAVAMSLIVAMGVADVARALVARAHAERAADLAALAAAQELALPTGEDPASFAVAYAAANDARLVSCSCAAGSQEAVVSVAVDVGGFLLPLPDREVVATARAVVDVPV
jgi:secretion/DNA translocation related TadE-like protein